MAVETVLGFAAAPWLGGNGLPVTTEGVGFVNEHDVGEFAQGHRFVALGQTPQLPMMASRVEKDRILRRPEQRWDAFLWVADQNPAFQPGRNDETIKDVLHNPLLYQ